MDKSIFSIPQAAESPGFLLWQVSNLWQRAIKKALEEDGLTHVQFVILAGVYWLSLHEKETTQANIAAHAKTDVMMTSKVVRSLEAKGLLSRLPHPTDTRANRVGLTPDGELLLRSAMKKVESFDALFFQIEAPDAAVFNFILSRIIEKNNYI